MVFAFFKNLFKKRPRPSDYIGKTDKEAAQIILAGKALKDCLTWKKKREELRIIREVDCDEHEIRRIP